MKIGSWIVLTAAVLILSLAVIVHNMTRFHRLPVYDCDGPAQFDIKPRLGKFPNRLEIYMGGWIERGEVSIDGFPSYDLPQLRFEAENGISTVSHAYRGDWYEPVTTIKFSPGADASCYISIIYKIQ